MHSDNNSPSFALLLRFVIFSLRIFFQMFMSLQQFLIKLVSVAKKQQNARMYSQCATIEVLLRQI